MKLKVKPLKGGEFSLDKVELSNTVLEIKEMIQAAKGEEDFPVESQKLIHAGKIMKDESKLAEYKIKPEEEGGFIVCMISKKRQPKPQQQEQVHTQTSANPSTQAQASGAASQRPTSPTRAPVAASSNAQTGAAVPAQTGAAAAGIQITDEAVNDLVSMGFAETDARAALVAAYGNVQRACDYLLTGNIPEEAPGQTGLQDGGAANLSPLEAFRRHPQFDAIRVMVQNNPQALGQILEQIATADPELHAAIQADQNAFIQMLQEPVAMEEDAMPTPQQLMEFFRDIHQLTDEQRNFIAQQTGIGVDQLQQVAEAMQNLPPEAIQALVGEMGDGRGPRRGMQQIPPNAVRLTPQEMQAVDRLVELGYSKAECIQAYLACDKDENAAANLLFQNPPEDDTQNDAMDTSRSNPPPS